MLHVCKFHFDKPKSFRKLFKKRVEFLICDISCGSSPWLRKFLCPSFTSQLKDFFLKSSQIVYEPGKWFSLGSSPEIFTANFIQPQSIINHLDLFYWCIAFHDEKLAYFTCYYKHLKVLDSFYKSCDWKDWRVLQKGITRPGVHMNEERGSTKLEFKHVWLLTNLEVWYFAALG